MWDKSGSSFFPTQIPSQLCQHCDRQFPVRPQQGSSCPVSCGDRVGFRSKGKLSSLMEERRGESSHSLVWALPERLWAGLLYRDLPRRRGQSSQSVGTGTAPHSPDLRAGGSVSAHSLPQAPSWIEVLCAALLHLVPELRCRHGHFSKNSVWSEALGTAVACWDR